jgi:putative transposase
MPRRRNRLPAETYKIDGTLWHITIASYLRDNCFSEIATARLVTESLRFHADRDHANLLLYCLMPDHLHVLIAVSGESLEDTVRRFKSWTTNQWMKSHPGNQLWQPSFYDHGIRSTEKIDDVVAYILNNPVRKGIVDSWENYPWIGGSLLEDVE